MAVQDYPRMDETSPYSSCLDTSTLVPHQHKIPLDQLKEFIKSAIINANKKSSREILSIPPTARQEEIDKIYKKAGQKLFNYFKKYYSDPAATAHQIYGRHYRDVGKEQFRNQTLQKERMNSGWRYQFLVIDCAQHSPRFRRVSDLGANEADFNTVIEFLDKTRGHLNLYVSIKNRSNTMGGQDWPKAIHALEKVAREDKNRAGPYCCVFGIVMDRGTRVIRHEKKTNRPYSVNTEIWFSDFFWPFFANYSYEEIMTAVLDVLLESHAQLSLPTEFDIPEPLLNSFGDACRKADLIDTEGKFNDPYKLVRLFCQSTQTRVVNP